MGDEGQFWFGVEEGYIVDIVVLVFSYFGYMDYCLCLFDISDGGEVEWMVLLMVYFEGCEQFLMWLVVLVLLDLLGIVFGVCIFGGFFVWL